jgi:NAD(P)-dependent dehydrogenase (short-subunit alcohol dehydrogenase family)
MRLRPLRTPDPGRGGGTRGRDEEDRVKNLFSVEGKVVVVTGGSRGIGEMITRGFVAGGAKVYISARKADACERLAAELSATGPCVAIPADLGTDAGCKLLAEEVGKREKELHVLVNNAGANWGAPYAEFPDSAWDKVLAINLKGVFHLTRYLTPLLEAGSKPGDPARVINIGSIDGVHVPPLETYAYSASKAAVHHMTRVLAKRLAPKITVNAVAPGPFESKMMAETIRRYKDSIIAGCPLGRIGEPEDMAGVAIYLSSRAGAYVTGAVLTVDGGMSTCL